MLFSRIFFKKKIHYFSKYFFLYFLVEAILLNLTNWFSILYMVKSNPWLIQRRKNTWICQDGFLMCRHLQKWEAIDQKYHLVEICCIEWILMMKKKMNYFISFQYFQEWIFYFSFKIFRFSILNRKTCYYLL